MRENDAQSTKAARNNAPMRWIGPSVALGGRPYMMMSAKFPDYLVLILFNQTILLCINIYLTDYKTWFFNKFERYNC